MVQLCVGEVRKRIKEHFGSKEVPGKIEEALRMCEREVDERTESLRMLIGALQLVTDIEVAACSFKKDGEDRRWKQAVREVMEERVKKRENEAGYYDRERGGSSWRLEWQERGQ